MISGESVTGLTPKNRCHRYRLVTGESQPPALSGQVVSNETTSNLVDRPAAREAQIA